jgi:hypothetical protein
MKKFVILRSEGTWERLPDGRKSIDCTVKNKTAVAESNDWAEMWQKAQELENGERYLANGVWYSFSVEKRANAKRELACYMKKEA